MISRQQAKKAMLDLREKLGQPEWLRDVTLGLSSTGVCIRVSVENEVTDVIKALVPPVVDGVEVILELAVASTPLELPWMRHT